MWRLTHTIWIKAHTAQVASRPGLYSPSLVATNPSVSWSLGGHGFDRVQMILCSANVIHVQTVQFGVGTPKSHWPLIKLLNPICKGEELAHVRQQRLLPWVSQVKNVYMGDPVHFWSDTSRKHRAAGTWQLQSCKQQWISGPASWLEKVSERSVCVWGGESRLCLPIFVVSSGMHEILFGWWDVNIGVFF